MMKNYNQWNNIFWLEFFSLFGFVKKKKRKYCYFCLDETKKTTYGKRKSIHMKFKKQKKEPTNKNIEEQKL